MNSRFGTIMLWLSPLMIVVARMLIRSTLPVVPATVTTSPIRIGRSSSRMMPQTKLETISWRPKPSPTPRAASDHADLGHAEVNGPQRRDRRDPEHGVAAERHDGEPDARVVGNPREERDGEERAHVSPGQDCPAGSADRPGQVAERHRRLVGQLPERLVGQESDEREVELPDPGQSRARRAARPRKAGADAAGRPGPRPGRDPRPECPHRSGGRLGAPGLGSRDGPRKDTAEVRARAQDRPGRPHRRDELGDDPARRPRWKVQQSQDDGQGLGSSRRPVASRCSGSRARRATMIPATTARQSPGEQPPPPAEPRQPGRGRRIGDRRRVRRIGLAADAGPASSPDSPRRCEVEPRHEPGAPVQEPEQGPPDADLEDQDEEPADARGRDRPPFGGDLSVGQQVGGNEADDGRGGEEPARPAELAADRRGDAEEPLGPAVAPRQPGQDPGNEDDRGPGRGVPSRPGRPGSAATAPAAPPGPPGRDRPARSTPTPAPETSDRKARLTSLALASG